MTLYSSTMSIFCCKEKLLMKTLKSSIYSYLTLAIAVASLPEYNDVLRIDIFLQIDHALIDLLMPVYKIHPVLLKNSFLSL